MGINFRMFPKLGPSKFLHDPMLTEGAPEIESISVHIRPDMFSNKPCLAHHLGETPERGGNHCPHCRFSRFWIWSLSSKGRDQQKPIELTNFCAELPPKEWVLFNMSKQTFRATGWFSRM